MTSGMRRVEKLEAGLTPKQAFLLWLQEAHAFNRIEEYVRHLRTQPDSAAPIPKLTTQVEEAAKQNLKVQPRKQINTGKYLIHKHNQILKGLPQQEIDRAVHQARKDVLFLFFLHQQVNSKLMSENRYYWTRWLLLSKELKSLLREQSLDRQMRWNRIMVGIEMPYPLDSETAAAVEAAQQHHVLTWEVLEEGTS